MEKFGQMFGRYVLASSIVKLFFNLFEVFFFLVVGHDLHI